MARLFKPTYPKPIHPDAKIRTHDGRPRKQPQAAAPRRRKRKEP
jgi:hypothetical protein